MTASKNPVVLSAAAVPGTIKPPPSDSIAVSKTNNVKTDNVQQKRSRGERIAISVGIAAFVIQMLSIVSHGFATVQEFKLLQEVESSMLDDDGYYATGLFVEDVQYYHPTLFGNEGEEYYYSGLVNNDGEYYYSSLFDDDDGAGSSESSSTNNKPLPAYRGALVLAGISFILWVIATPVMFRSGRVYNDSAKISTTTSADADYPTPPRRVKGLAWAIASFIFYGLNILSTILNFLFSFSIFSNVGMLLWNLLHFALMWVFATKCRRNAAKAESHHQATLLQVQTSTNKNVENKDLIKENKASALPQNNTMDEDEENGQGDGVTFANL